MNATRKATEVDPVMEMDLSLQRQTAVAMGRAMGRTVSYLSKTNGFLAALQSSLDKVERDLNNGCQLPDRKVFESRATEALERRMQVASFFEAFNDYFHPTVIDWPEQNKRGETFYYEHVRALSVVAELIREDKSACYSLSYIFGDFLEIYIGRLHVNHRVAEDMIKCYRFESFMDQAEKHRKYIDKAFDLLLLLFGAKNKTRRGCLDIDSNSFYYRSFHRIRSEKRQLFPWPWDDDVPVEKNEWIQVLMSNFDPTPDKDLALYPEEEEVSFSTKLAFLERIRSLDGGAVAVLAAATPQERKEHKEYLAQRAKKKEEMNAEYEIDEDELIKDYIVNQEEEELADQMEENFLNQYEDELMVDARDDVSVEDVTDEMLARREAERQQQIADAELIESDDDGV